MSNRQNVDLYSVAISSKPVVSQQAATPTLPNSSTEARADAELAISTDADQLRAIPRRLQNHTKSWL